MKSVLILICLVISTITSFGQDWPALERFKKDNALLKSDLPVNGRIVMMGNSITEGWEKLDPDFFKKHHLINRGISGQTTPQMVLRFRQDVIDLKPEKVVILGGINDIAGNTGPSTLKMIQDNIQNMAVLARDAGIEVILCSVLPANKIPWRNNMDPSSKVKELNAWIKQFADRNGFGYVDYYTALVDSRDGLQEEYTSDGVHPNLDGYRVMEKCLIHLLAR